MAPVPSTSSPVKGKTRVYLCGPCGFRHAAPTGAKCRLARPALRRPTLAKKTVTRRGQAQTRRVPSALTPPTVARVGRPRKQTSKTSGSASSRAQTSTPIASTSTPNTDPASEEALTDHRSDEETDDESLEAFLTVHETPGACKHSADPDFDVPPAKRTPPRPAPRRKRLVAQRTYSTSPSLSHSPLSPLPSVTPNDGLSAVLTQLAILQNDNKREMARIEAESRAARAQMQLDGQVASDNLRSAINDLKEAFQQGMQQRSPAVSRSYHQSPTAPLPVRQPAPESGIVPRTPAGATTIGRQPGPDTGVTVQPSATGMAPQRSAAAGRAQDLPPLETYTAPAVLKAPVQENQVVSLEGQPPVLGLLPGDLAHDDQPIRSLRKDDSTSEVATIILQEVGLARAIELEKEARKSKHRSIKKSTVKWPHHYVYRMTDPSPKYDTLTTAEFVSGYLSIMEEVTPVTSENAPFLRHLYYLRHLMDDCASMDWESARTVYSQVLQAMEHNKIKWSNTQAVKEEKALAVQQVRFTDTVAKKKEEPLEVPCPAYQKASCSSRGEHTVDAVKQLHCCAYCHRRFGDTHPHPQRDCRKFNKRPKNGRVGSQEQRD